MNNNIKFIRFMHQLTKNIISEIFRHEATVFPPKNARFSKIKNIPDLLSDDKEGKIM